MRLTLRFEFYSTEEITQIATHRCKSLGWQVDQSVFERVAQRSRGVPRLALRLLQSCRRVCRARGGQAISLDHLETACLLEQIDHLGLGPTETKYLELLASGATRLNVLSSILGLPTRTVSQVVEPFLIRSGLIVKDDQGRRQLTASGREHLSPSRRDLD